MSTHKSSSFYLVNLKNEYKDGLLHFKEVTFTIAREVLTNFPQRKKKNKTLNFDKDFVLIRIQLTTKKSLR